MLSLISDFSFRKIEINILLVSKRSNIILQKKKNILKIYENTESLTDDFIFHSIIKI